MDIIVGKNPTTTNGKKSGIITVVPDYVVACSTQETPGGCDILCYEKACPLLTFI